MKNALCNSCKGRFYFMPKKAFAWLVLGQEGNAGWNERNRTISVSNLSDQRSLTDH
jgi:hypothetical protein